MFKKLLLAISWFVLAILPRLSVTPTPFIIYCINAVVILGSLIYLKKRFKISERFPIYSLTALLYVHYFINLLAVLITVETLH